MNFQTALGKFQKQLREIAPVIGDANVLKTLSVVNRNLCAKNDWTPIDERINNRAERYKRITTSGHLYLLTWSRDCDCVESAGTTKINASSFPAFEKSFYENLEGPGYIRVISKDEYDAYVPEEPRDRILEAFEEGSNYFV